VTVLDRFRHSEQIPLPLSTILAAEAQIAVNDEVISVENDAFLGKVVAFEGEKALKALVRVIRWHGPTIPRSPVPVPRAKLRRA